MDDEHKHVHTQIEFILINACLEPINLHTKHSAHTVLQQPLHTISRYTPYLFIQNFHRFRISKHTNNTPHQYKVGCVENLNLTGYIYIYISVSLTNAFWARLRWRKRNKLCECAVRYTDLCLTSALKNLNASLSDPGIKLDLLLTKRVLDCWPMLNINGQRINLVHTHAHLIHFCSRWLSGLAFEPPDEHLLYERALWM